MPVRKHRYLLLALSVLSIGVAGYFAIPVIFSGSTGAVVETGIVTNVASADESAEVSDDTVAAAPKVLAPAAHLATPVPLKGLYMTSWVAGTRTMRDHVISVAEKSGANAIVVDLKDYTGKIAYPVEDPALVAIGASERRIPNLRDLTALMHEKGIYVIGRVACFQDPYFVSLHPEYAVKTKTDQNKIWRDRKGISWIDAGAQPVWDYLVSIAKDAHAQGVDEIQFDYTRFPSDGNMQDIYYPASEGMSKVETMDKFWTYLHDKLAGTGIVTSADLFGMTTTNTDDLGIGQNLESALRNFDYVSPMVYPSHWPSGWNNFKKPEAQPYETIKISMGKAVERAQAIGVPTSKLRPWLQNFGLRMNYGPKEISEQIRASNDVGLDSWMLWDPTTRFEATVAALSGGN